MLKETEKHEDSHAKSGERLTSKSKGSKETHESPDKTYQ